MVAIVLILVIILIIVCLNSKPKKNDDHVISNETEKKKDTFLSKITFFDISFQYDRPPLSLLNKRQSSITNESELRENAIILQKTMEVFKINATLTDIHMSYLGILYEFVLDGNTSVNDIKAIQDEIKYALAADQIELLIPFPGKSSIGIRVRNRELMPVFFMDLLSEQDPISSIPIGKDIMNNIIKWKYYNSPNLLIGGATGSGKSMFLNTVIMYLVYMYNPLKARLILINTKRTEFIGYNVLPHMLLPVIRDEKKAIAALKWLIKEIQERIDCIQRVNAKDIRAYNHKIEALNDSRYVKLPMIFVIIDDIYEIMESSYMVSDDLQRVLSLARTAGIVVILSTQRPSIDVLSGSIKANIMNRIAFKTASKADSRVILDDIGAETLNGKGEMLFKSDDYRTPVRIQGAYISDSEIDGVLSFMKEKYGNGNM